ncbi:MAG: sigma-70 family RNA polymerase sigma factor [Planctomycetes bacterium]|nr:sigma-70 family RNA polymerase sigma factor [Planctomycetota bacterium]
MPSHAHGSGDGGSRFPATRGSVLASLAGDDESARATAWEDLVGVYWRPVYKYIRLRWRRNPHDAEDLTQGFFTKALEKDFLSRYDPGRARFRTYLRTCLDGYVLNEAQASTAAKRGGGKAALSLDFPDAEREVGTQPAPREDQIDEFFRTEWVRGLFASALADLKRTLERAGHGARFDAFQRYDLAESEPRPTYEELGREFGVPATTVTNWLHDARRRFRGHVLDRLRATTATDEEMREEARALFGKEYDR